MSMRFSPLWKGRTRAILAMCVVAPLMAGCIVGPDYRTPLMAMPASWGPSARIPAKPAELAQWWKRLGDETLNALIEEAVAGNLDVASANAKVREARATIRQAKGSLQPSLDGTAAATRARTAVSEGGSANTGSTFQAGLDASWEIDLFGANRRNVEAAKYGLDAAGEDLRATLLTLIGDVASAQRDHYFIAYRSSVLAALEDVENALVSLAQEGPEWQACDLSQTLP